MSSATKEVRNKFRRAVAFFSFTDSDQSVISP